MAETKQKTASEAKEEAAPKEEPEAKGSVKAGAPLPGLEQALEWNGMRIDGLGVKTLGRIAESMSARLPASGRTSR